MTVRKLLFTLRVTTALAVLSFIAFAIAAPFLVEGQAMRKHLRERFAALTGGEVESMGRIKLASFLALTVEVEDVKLRSTARLSPVEGIDAKSVKAIVGFADLLTGNLRFDRVIVDSPRLSLTEDFAPSLSHDAIPELLSALLAIDEPSVAELHVTNPSFSGGAFDGQQYQLRSLKFDQSSSGKKSIRLHGHANATKVSLDVRTKRDPQTGGHRITATLKGDGFDSSFSGTTAASVSNLAGRFRFSVSDTAKFAALVGETPSFDPQRGPVSVEGGLTYTGQRWTLDDASFRVGRSYGSGFLSLNASADRYTLEGTTNWSLLVLEDILPRLSNDDRPNLPHEDAVASSLAQLDADVRVSADDVHFRTQLFGPLAAAVSLKSGRIAADLAELHIFGGSARGRLEADLNSNELLFLGASVEGTDLTTLALSLGAEPVLKGRADVNADLRSIRLLGDGGITAEGRVRIAVPERSFLAEALSKRISTGLAGHDPSLRGYNALPLEGFRLDAELDGRAASIQVGAVIPNSGFAHASATVDLSSLAMSGRIGIARDDQAIDTTASIGQPPARPNTLSFSGPIAHVLFSADNALTLSN